MGIACRCERAAGAPEAWRLRGPLRAATQVRASGKAAASGPVASAAAKARREASFSSREQIGGAGIATRPVSDYSGLLSRPGIGRSEMS